MISLKNILVPTDFGEHSQKAIAYGVELAKRFDASLCLVHTVEVIPIAYSEGGYVPLETSAEIVAGAVKQLDDGVPMVIIVESHLGIARHPAIDDAAEGQIERDRTHHVVAQAHEQVGGAQGDFELVGLGCPEVFIGRRGSG